MAPIHFSINDWDGNGSTDDLYDIFMDMKICENFQKKEEEDFLNSLYSIDVDLDCDYNDDCNCIDREVDTGNENEDEVIKVSEMYKLIWIALSSVLKEYIGLDFKGETNPKKIEEMLNYYKDGWRKKCESGSDYFLSPYKYKTEAEYVAVLEYAKKIKEKYEARINNLTKNYYIDEKCEGNRIYTYCGVVFESNTMVFHYKTDNEHIKPGDVVIVPVGLNNEEKEATVVSVGKYLSNAVPYPIEKTKEIIRMK